MYVCMHPAVELVFHLFGVDNFHEMEAPAQAVDDGFAELRRLEKAFDHLHVFALLQDGDDGGVGRRTADTFALQRFDQSRLGKTLGRFGLLFFDLSVARDMLLTGTQNRQGQGGFVLILYREIIQCGGSAAGIICIC